MEVMPSKSVSNLMIEGRITKTTRIFQFLIKICFIPVSVKNCKIVFQVFSLKILVYILCAVLWNIFTTRMMFVFMKHEDFDRFISEVYFFSYCYTPFKFSFQQSMFEKISLISSLGSGSVALMLPLFFAHGLQKLNTDILFCRNHQPQRTGRFLIGRK